MYICDLFYFFEGSNIANYANDTTLCICQKIWIDVQTKPGKDFSIFIEWSKNNYLKADSGKHNTFLTSDNVLQVKVEGSSLISNKDMVNLLVIVADKGLSFSLIKGEFAKKVAKTDMSLQEY